MCAAGCDAKHEIYGKVRTASEFVERLGKERELRIEAVAKLRADGGTEAEAITLSEDGWLPNDAAWVQCFGDAAKLSANMKADKEGRIVEVVFKDQVAGQGGSEQAGGSSSSTSVAFGTGQNVFGKQIIDKSRSYVVVQWPKRTEYKMKNSQTDVLVSGAKGV